MRGIGNGSRRDESRCPRQRRRIPMPLLSTRPVGFLVLAALALASPAPAQSINFDYSTNFGTGPWHNAPSATFGLAHRQTGHWIHSEATSVWFNLDGLDGNPTLADLNKS